MRKWFLPMTVLGLSGLGVFLASDRGREVLRRVRDRFDEAPDRLQDWTDSYQDELGKIQATLDNLAEKLSRSDPSSDPSPRESRAT